MQAEVVQATTGFHQLILHVFAPQPQFIFDDPASFHTPDDMLHAHPHAGNAAVRRTLVWRQRATSRFFCGCSIVTPATTKP